MSGRGAWSRGLVIAGLVAAVVGVVDPLEGSLVIFAGSALVALGAMLGASRHKGFLVASLFILGAGVAALWGLSALGGFGGNSGHPMWWGLVIIPYPVGWVMTLIGAIRTLRETPASAIAAHTH